MGNLRMRYRSVTALLSLAALAGSAQELRLEPRLSLSYEHSDNLFLDPDTFQASEDAPVQTPISDSTLVITPGIVAELTGQRARLSLVYDFGHTHYNDHSELDAWRHDARFVGEADLTPDTVLMLRGEFLRTEDPLAGLQYEVNRDPESITDPDPTAASLREPYTIHTAAAGLTHTFSDSDSIYAEYSHSTRDEEAATADEYSRDGILSRFTYWNDSGWGGELEGGLNRSDFELGADVDTWSARAKAGKKLTRTTEVFGQYSHEFVENGATDSGGSDSTYHVLNPEAGLTYTSPRGGSLAASAGFFQRDRDHGTDTSGFSGNLQLIRQSERSAISLYAATGHDDSIYSRESSEASTFHEAGVRLGYNVSQAVNLSLFTSYRQDDYDESEDVDDAPETETPLIRTRGDGDTLGAGITLAYQPRSWCSLQLNYGFRDRTADRPEDEYQENRASIMLRISAPYRVGSISDALDVPTEL